MTLLPSQGPALDRLKGRDVPNTLPLLGVFQRRRLDETGGVGAGTYMLQLPLSGSLRHRYHAAGNAFKL